MLTFQLLNRGNSATLTPRYFFFHK
jgi:hypothetical protein